MLDRSLQIGGEFGKYKFPTPHCRLSVTSSREPSSYAQDPPGLMYLPCIHEIGNVNREAFIDCAFLPGQPFQAAVYQTNAPIVYCVPKAAASLEVHAR